MQERKGIEEKRVSEEAPRPTRRRRQNPRSTSPEMGVASLSVV